MRTRNCHIPAAAHSFRHPNARQIQEYYQWVRDPVRRSMLKRTPASDDVAARGGAIGTEVSGNEISSKPHHAPQRTAPTRQQAPALTDLQVQAAGRDPNKGLPRRIEAADPQALASQASARQDEEAKLVLPVRYLDPGPTRRLLSHERDELEAAEAARKEAEEARRRAMEGSSYMPPETRGFGGVEELPPGMRW